MTKRMRKGTTFIIIRPDKTILMQLRDDKSKFYPRTWCFPGGLCDSGEDPIDAVIREAQEEYGLRLKKSNCTKLMKYKPKYYGKNLIDYVFICSIDSSQKPVLHEGVDMKWMTLKEIMAIDLGFEQKAYIPPMKDFLRQKWRHKFS